MDERRFQELERLLVVSGQDSDDVCELLAEVRRLRGGLIAPNATEAAPTLIKEADGWYWQTAPRESRPVGCFKNVVTTRLGPFATRDEAIASIRESGYAGTLFLNNIITRSDADPGFRVG